MASAALYLWTTTNPLLAATWTCAPPKKSAGKGGNWSPPHNLDNCVDVNRPQHMLFNRVPTIITLGPVN